MVVKLSTDELRPIRAPQEMKPGMITASRSMCAE